MADKKNVLGSISSGIKKGKEPISAKIPEAIPTMIDLQPVVAQPKIKPVDPIISNQTTIGGGSVASFEPIEYLVFPKEEKKLGSISISSGAESGLNKTTREKALGVLAKPIVSVVDTIKDGIDSEAVDYVKNLAPSLIERSNIQDTVDLFGNKNSKYTQALNDVVDKDQSFTQFAKTLTEGRENTRLGASIRGDNGIGFVNRSYNNIFERAEKISPIFETWVAINEGRFDESNNLTPGKAMSQLPDVEEKMYGELKSFFEYAGIDTKEMDNVDLLFNYTKFYNKADEYRKAKEGLGEKATIGKAVLGIMPDGLKKVAGDAFDVFNSYLERQDVSEGEFANIKDQSEKKANERTTNQNSIVQEKLKTNPNVQINQNAINQIFMGQQSLLEQRYLKGSLSDEAVKRYMETTKGSALSSPADQELLQFHASARLKYDTQTKRIESIGEKMIDRMMNNEDAPTVDEFYKANPELKKQMDNILSDTDDLLNLANAKLNFNASTNRMGKAESLDDYAIEAIISFVNGSAVISQGAVNVLETGLSTLGKGASLVFPSLISDPMSRQGLDSLKQYMFAESILGFKTDSESAKQTMSVIRSIKQASPDIAVALVEIFGSGKLSASWGTSFAKGTTNMANVFFKTGAYADRFRESAPQLARIADGFYKLIQSGGRGAVGMRDLLKVTSAGTRNIANVGDAVAQSFMSARVQGLFVSGIFEGYDSLGYTPQDLFVDTVFGALENGFDALAIYQQKFGGEIERFSKVIDDKRFQRILAEKTYGSQVFLQADQQLQDSMVEASKAMLMGSLSNAKTFDKEMHLSIAKVFTETRDKIAGGKLTPEHRYNAVIDNTEKGAIKSEVEKMETAADLVGAGKSAKKKNTVVNKPPVKVNPDNTQAYGVPPKTYGQGSQVVIRTGDFSLDDLWNDWFSIKNYKTHQGVLDTFGANPSTYLGPKYNLDSIDDILDDVQQKINNKIQSISGNADKVVDFDKKRIDMRYTNEEKIKLIEKSKKKKVKIGDREYSVYDIMTVWSKDPQIFEIPKYTGDVLTDAVLDMYLQTRKMSGLANETVTTRTKNYLSNEALKSLDPKLLEAVGGGAFDLSSLRKRIDDIKGLSVDQKKLSNYLIDVYPQLRNVVDSMVAMVLQRSQAEGFQGLDINSIVMDYIIGKTLKGDTLPVTFLTQSPPDVQMLFADIVAENPKAFDNTPLGELTTIKNADLLEKSGLVSNEQIKQRQKTQVYSMVGGTATAVVDDVNVILADHVYKNMKENFDKNGVSYDDKYLQETLLRLFSGTVDVGDAGNIVKQYYRQSNISAVQEATKTIQLISDYGLNTAKQLRAKSLDEVADQTPVKLVDKEGKIAASFARTSGLRSRAQSKVNDLLLGIEKLNVDINNLSTERNSLLLKQQNGEITKGETKSLQKKVKAIERKEKTLQNKTQELQKKQSTLATYDERLGLFSQEVKTKAEAVAFADRVAKEWREKEQAKLESIIRRKEEKILDKMVDGGIDFIDPELQDLKAQLNSLGSAEEAYKKIVLNNFAVDEERVVKEVVTQSQTEKEYAKEYFGDFFDNMKPEELPETRIMGGPIAVDMAKKTEENLTSLAIFDSSNFAYSFLEDILGPNATDASNAMLAEIGILNQKLIESDKGEFGSLLAKRLYKSEGGYLKTILDFVQGVAKGDGDALARGYRSFLEGLQKYSPYAFRFVDGFNDKFQSLVEISTNLGSSVGGTLDEMIYSYMVTLSKQDYGSISFNDFSKTEVGKAVTEPMSERDLARARKKFQNIYHKLSEAETYISEIISAFGYGGSVKKLTKSGEEVDEILNMAGTTGFWKFAGVADEKTMTDIRNALNKGLVEGSFVAKSTGEVYESGNAFLLDFLGIKSLSKSSMGKLRVPLAGVSSTSAFNEFITGIFGSDKNKFRGGVGSLLISHSKGWVRAGTILTGYMGFVPIIISQSVGYFAGTLKTLGRDFDDEGLSDFARRYNILTRQTDIDSSIADLILSWGGDSKEPMPYFARLGLIGRKIIGEGKKFTGSVSVSGAYQLSDLMFESVNRNVALADALADLGYSSVKEFDDFYKGLSESQQRIWMNKLQKGVNEQFKRLVGAPMDSELGMMLTDVGLAGETRISGIAGKVPKIIVNAFGHLGTRGYNQIKGVTDLVGGLAIDSMRTSRADQFIQILERDGLEKAQEFARSVSIRNRNAWRFISTLTMTLNLSNNLARTEFGDQGLADAHTIWAISQMLYAPTGSAMSFPPFRLFMSFFLNSVVEDYADRNDYDTMKWRAMESGRVFLRELFKKDKALLMALAGTKFTAETAIQNGGLDFSDLSSIIQNYMGEFAGYERMMKGATDAIGNPKQSHKSLMGQIVIGYDEMDKVFMDTSRLRTLMNNEDNLIRYLSYGVPGTTFWNNFGAESRFRKVFGSKEMNNFLYGERVDFSSDPKVGPAFGEYVWKKMTRFSDPSGKEKRRESGRDIFRGGTRGELGSVDNIVGRDDRAMFDIMKSTYEMGDIGGFMESLKKGRNMELAYLFAEANTEGSGIQLLGYHAEILSNEYEDAIKQGSKATFDEIELARSMAAEKLFPIFRDVDKRGTTDAMITYLFLTKGEEIPRLFQGGKDEKTGKRSGRDVRLSNDGIMPSKDLESFMLTDVATRDFLNKGDYNPFAVNNFLAKLVSVSNGDATDPKRVGNIMQIAEQVMVNIENSNATPFQKAGMKAGVGFYLSPLIDEVLENDDLLKLGQFNTDTAKPDMTTKTGRLQNAFLSAFRHIYRTKREIDEYSKEQKRDEAESKNGITTKDDPESSKPGLYNGTGVSSSGLSNIKPLYSKISNLIKKFNQKSSIKKFPFSSVKQPDYSKFQTLAIKFNSYVKNVGQQPTERKLPRSIGEPRSRRVKRTKAKKLPKNTGRGKT